MTPMYVLLPLLKREYTLSRLASTSFTAFALNKNSSSAAPPCRNAALPPQISSPRLRMGSGGHWSLNARVIDMQACGGWRRDHRGELTLKTGGWCGGDFRCGMGQLSELVAPVTSGVACERE